MWKINVLTLLDFKNMFAMKLDLSTLHSLFFVFVDVFFLMFVKVCMSVLESRLP
jgi:hypothetical protein